jgi:TolB-like protein/Tfp pilus assembly protein PilF
MATWTAEIKELEKLLESFKGKIPELEKELGQLIKSEDPNVLMLYSRRCLEVIITDLCECELKRPRKTEPLKGIIDKLNKEEKIPSYIITSMHSLNSLSTYGAHPKDFDPEQVKPVLNNLAIILKWYLKYRESRTLGTEKTEAGKSGSKLTEVTAKPVRKKNKSLVLWFGVFLIVVATVVALMKFNIISIGRQATSLANLEKSIAILPFKNDSPDSTNTYFINGLMEDILNNLQRIKDMRVISRTSVEQYRNQTKSIPEIAKELGVNYIVEGSGQKFGNTIHLSIQLLRAAKEGHLWGNSYEKEIRNVKEIFDIQKQISEAIAAELKAVITPQEKHLIEKVPTENLEAYDAYQKGRFYLYKLTPNDLEAAMKYFELAKEKDPNYALAYSGISYVWAVQMQMGYLSPAEAGPKSMEALMKAVELDSNNAEIVYSQAGINTWVMWDWEGGEAAFKKSIELNPNHTEAHAYYSHFLNMMGRQKEAKEQIEIALKLDPYNPLIKSLNSMDLVFFHKYEEAIAASREALNLDNTAIVALAGLAYALHLSGKYDEALSAFKSVYSILYKNNIHAFDQGYAKEGYFSALICEADTLSAGYKTLYVNPSDIAVLYAFGGRKEQALYWLEQGYEVRDPNMPYLLLPIYDSLRNEPRFQELIRKMNLPYK